MQIFCPGRLLVFEDTGRCCWKILKGSLSWSQILEDDTLSLKSCKETCVLPSKFVGNLSENDEMLPSKKSKSYLRKANGMQLRYRVSYAPCHGAGYRKMMSCPGVRILKMMPYPVAHPCWKNLYQSKDLNQKFELRLFWYSNVY